MKWSNPSDFTPLLLCKHQLVENWALCPLISAQRWPASVPADGWHIPSSSAGLRPGSCLSLETGKCSESSERGEGYPDRQHQQSSGERRPIRWSDRKDGWPASLCRLLPKDVHTGGEEILVEKHKDDDHNRRDCSDHRHPHHPRCHRCNINHVCFYSGLKMITVRPASFTSGSTIPRFVMFRETFVHV